MSLHILDLVGDKIKASLLHQLISLCGSPYSLIVLKQNYLEGADRSSYVFMYADGGVVGRF